MGEGLWGKKGGYGVLDMELEGIWDFRKILITRNRGVSWYPEFK
jgi:hypothetical protein